MYNSSNRIELFQSIAELQVLETKLFFLFPLLCFRFFSSWLGFGCSRCKVWSVTVWQSLPSSRVLCCLFLSLSLSMTSYFFHCTISHVLFFTRSLRVATWSDRTTTLSGMTRIRSAARLEQNDEAEMEFGPQSGLRTQWPRVSLSHPFYLFVTPGALRILNPKAPGIDLDINYRS